MNYLAINIRGIRGDGKVGWIKGLKVSNNIHFLAIQETKLNENTWFNMASVWGRTVFESEQVFSMGTSGGLVSIWDPCMFKKISVHKNRHYLMVVGVLVVTGECINIVNVHAPNDPSSRRTLWLELSQLKRLFHGLWLFMGDFNDVRYEEERVNSDFVHTNARHFNSFILDADLKEYNMGGRKYTYMSDNGEKMSKLDRFLVCSSFFNRWPQVSVATLSRNLSDHSPILLCCTWADFGHIPFKTFNTWLEIPGFVDFITTKCSSFVFSGPADLAISTKLRFLKNQIKWWVSNEKKRKEREYADMVKELDSLEKVAETRQLLQSELDRRMSCKSHITSQESIKARDSKQKSRIKWAMEEDENSKFFHLVINSNITNNRINGILVDSDWMTDPMVIKNEAVSFFTNKY